MCRFIYIFANPDSGIDDFLYVPLIENIYCHSEYYEEYKLYPSLYSGWQSANFLNKGEDSMLMNNPANKLTGGYRASKPK
jgi:hypothetical protein